MLIARMCRRANNVDGVKKCSSTAHHGTTLGNSKQIFRKALFEEKTGIMRRMSQLQVVTMHVLAVIEMLKTTST